MAGTRPGGGPPLIRRVTARPGTRPGPDPAGYASARSQLQRQVAATPVGTPVRLAKRTSNLFRQRERGRRAQLDVHAFAGVLDVDVAGRTASVLGMTTYEELVDATLPYGLVPLVVPQLKSITLGGAVTGLGVESTSFRHGLPHESVLEMDILTGSGEVVTARPDGLHAELFYGFPNSYGTLGYALRLTIELMPVRRYVQIRHLAVGSAESAAATLRDVCTTGVSPDGTPVDFVDGVAFSPTDCYLTLGRLVDEAPRASDYTGRAIYYRSIRENQRDWLTVRDYLWRWDTDWFWCSRAFGAQHPVGRRLWPKSMRRSDVYWRLAAWERRVGVKRRLDRWAGRAPTEDVIQDVEIPVGRSAEFLRGFDHAVGMRPVWLCPLRQRDPSARWALYPLRPDELYVNVGFWGAVARPPGSPPDYYNRHVEGLVADLGGHKSLYSTACYPEDEFWHRYGGETYHTLKKRYDPDGRFLDLYDKCVRGR